MHKIRRKLLRERIMKHRRCLKEKLFFICYNKRELNRRAMRIKRALDEVNRILDGGCGCR